MKRRIILFLICAAMLLPLCACAADTVEELPAPVNEWTVLEGITLHLTQDEYPVGVENLTVVMENRSDQLLTYGNGWTYEKWKDGEWVSLKNSENAAFTSEAYVLFDHTRAEFTASTFALEKPLDAGLYRMTGCALYIIVPDDENPDEEEYIEYPAYQLEFVVSEDAEVEQQDDGARPAKEDWEWYTPYACLDLYQQKGYTVWQYIKDAPDGQLLAVLYREDTPENEVLEEGALLMLDLFDRTTGEAYTVFGRPSVTTGGVTASDGGFDAATADGNYYVGRSDGEWVVDGGADEAETAVYQADFSAQYVRTDGGAEGVEYPLVTVISSVDELNAYYESHRDEYDLAHRDTVYDDSTIGFIDAMADYDDAYFEDKLLLLALLEEGSGSNRHEVSGVTVYADHSEIAISRILPELGTCDMAHWHIFVEVLREQPGAAQPFAVAVEAVITNAQ